MVSNDILHQMSCVHTPQQNILMSFCSILWVASWPFLSFLRTHQSLFHTLRCLSTFCLQSLIWIHNSMFHPLLYHLNLLRLSHLILLTWTLMRHNLCMYNVVVNHMLWMFLHMFLKLMPFQTLIRLFKGSDPESTYCYFKRYICLTPITSRHYIVELSPRLSFVLCLCIFFFLSFVSISKSLVEAFSHLEWRQVMIGKMCAQLWYLVTGSSTPGKSLVGCR